MTRDNWQRLRNLALFKLWVTDRQLRRLWPLAALLAFIVFAGTAFWFVFAARGAEAPEQPAEMRSNYQDSSG